MSTWTVSRRLRSATRRRWLYNALPGEAYIAAQAANIHKSELVAKEGVAKLKSLKDAVRGTGPNRVGEIFDKYFDGGSRCLGTGINAWLTQRSEARQQLLGADPTTKISDTVEAYFPLKRDAATPMTRGSWARRCLCSLPTCTRQRADTRRRSDNRSGDVHLAEQDAARGGIHRRRGR